MQYLVVGEDPLVTEDLADIVLQCDPSGEVEVVPTLDALERMPGRSDSPLYLFVGLSVRRLTGSPVIRHHLEHASHVIIIGDAVGAPPDFELEWRFVPSPFTTDSITALLSELGRVSHERPPAFRAERPA